jgi:CRISPR/Cas system CSM-associated protein Csm3 (group 7 of RAMP superfamily)
MNWDRLENRSQRNIIEHIIIKGVLILDTPTGLGSGDVDGDTDLVILRDSLEDKALLMGSSIAGALRNYLREFDYQTIKTSLLFGSDRSNDEGEKSPLVVHDALSKDIIKVELRDGVKIDSSTGTATDKAKYDLELLEGGTKFDLCFELLIEENREQLIAELLIVLQGLEKGEINIGMKKRRGFGRCHVQEWQVWKFDLKKVEKLREWLKFEHWTTGLLPEFKIYQSISEAFTHLGIKTESKIEDRRNRLTIEAVFTLTAPLLIRSAQADIQKVPDDVHLKSKRDNVLKSIVSGTSLAGVLRHRAERILNTLEVNKKIIDEIFGFVRDKNDLEYKNSLEKAQASRLVVEESIINESNDFVQTRIAIDRFTGGALHGALFQEQPVFYNQKTNFDLKLELRQPKDYEVGLLLLLLKDLWTGDLPIGATNSIGRGRLQGKEATITWQREKNPKKWLIKASDNELQVEDLLNKKHTSRKVQEELNDIVSQLIQ